MEIRLLRADEIDARVQTVKDTGCSILLYKDARCDMRILDETFGVFGWQRHHEVINGNLFCNVGIRSDKHGIPEWIWKQDVGTESFSDKEKGQASDAFKRACFNIGIGRELYTAPFIWITLGPSETYKGNNNKLGVKTRFVVTDVGYDKNREIDRLEIKDDKGKVRYSFGAKKVIISSAQAEALRVLADKKGADIAVMEDYYGMKVEQMDIDIYTHAVKSLEKRADKKG